MRGVILAGGLGTRLGVSTTVVNKHCLPVYDRPMILWPLQVLLDNGITDITVVSTPQGLGEISSVLTYSGAKADFTYRVQDKPGGITHALACADDGSNRNVAVILGDNVFLSSPKLHVAPDHARCFLHESPTHNLRQFGVARFDNQWQAVVKEVIEKPDTPPSNHVVTGLYTFGPEVFHLLRDIMPSKRGEYEITSLLNERYAAQRRLMHSFFKGWWGDAGTPDGLLNCGAAVRKHLKLEEG